MPSKKELIQESFYFLSALLLSLAAFDYFFQGLISAYFNLNFIFLFWLFNAALLLCIKIKN